MPSEKELFSNRQIDPDFRTLALLRLDVEASAQLLDPFFNSQQPHAPRSRRIKTHAVVLDRHRERAILFADIHGSALRVRMTLHVMERFLHHTINARADNLRKSIRYILIRDFYFDSAASRYFPCLPFE